MNIVQSWSGGKDSTTAGCKHIELGHNVHFVCYVPYFDKDIPLISKKQFNYLLFMKDFLESLGAVVSFTSGLTYSDYCLKIITRGSRKNLYQGFPLFMRGKCGFNRDSKTKSISQFIENLDYDFIDIGLCYDEFDRKQLKGNEISILQQLKYIELDCFNYCKSRCILSPVYNTSFRDGCVLCPNAKSIARYNWFNDYKEFNAFDRLVELQRKLYQNAIDNGVKFFYPLRNYHFFIENEEFISPCGTNFFMFGSVIN